MDILFWIVIFSYVILFLMALVVVFIGDEAKSSIISAYDDTC